MNLFKNVPLLRRICRRKWQKSYAQSGEDLILDQIFGGLRIVKPSYLDIGAHDPVSLSNTYSFYARGCSGVCVEPMEAHCQRFAQQRRRDVCLNAGVGIRHETEADFYVLNPDVLSTFSKQTAENCLTNEGVRLAKVVKVPMLTINEIIQNHFSAAPNLISLDTEGSERELLETFDFGKFRPEVFCVETLKYSNERFTSKPTETTELMARHDYFLYADTWINSIFVDKRSWSKSL